MSSCSVLAFPWDAVQTWSGTCELRSLLILYVDITPQIDPADFSRPFAPSEPNSSTCS